MREAKLGVVVGKKGVGKTFKTIEIIRQYVMGNPSKQVPARRFLILDVNDEFEMFQPLSMRDIRRFSVHPIIEARRIRPFNEETGQRWTINEIQQALFTILEQYRGGGLLIEDINRYVSDSLPNDLIGAICTNRHTDTDIIMHFQGIGRISPKIWQNINWLRFHKLTESVDRHKNKFDDKYEYLKIAETLVNQKFFAGDERYFIYVDIDREKLLGNITRQDVDTALNEYIEKQYKRIINPLLQQKDLKTGTPKYTPVTAVEHVKKQFIMQHIN